MRCGVRHIVCLVRAVDIGRSRHADLIVTHSLALLYRQGRLLGTDGVVLVDFDGFVKLWKASKTYKAGR